MLLGRNMRRRMQVMEKERSYLGSVSPRLGRGLSPNLTLRSRL